MAQFKDKSILDLAEEISVRAKTLHEYLQKNSLEQPSLLREESGIDYLEKGDAKINKVRYELRSAAQQLDALAAGNTTWSVERSMFDMHDANCCRLLWMYNIPKHVPLEGSISYSELANKSGFDEDKLRRTMRYLLLKFVFVEPKPDHIAHNAVSRKYIPEIAWAWLDHMMDVCYPSVARSSEAFEKWGSDSRDGRETGMQLYLDTDEDVFTYFEKTSPRRLAGFGQAMQWSTKVTMPSMLAYEWKKFGKINLIDMGGSFGQKSVALARIAPEITCVVQDLASVISKAPPPPEDVADRVSLEAHDFFTPQKRTDMDIVFMARVLLDWPDAACKQILANLVPSMKKGCRLILNEFALQAPYEVPIAEQKWSYGFDMHMMSLMNGKQRSIDEWKTLIGEGSEGKLEFEWITPSLICFIKV